MGTGQESSHGNERSAHPGMEGSEGHGGKYDYHINAGVDRKVNVNVWEKGGAKRAYLTINCFTANGRSKGSYKCGYVDLVTNQYVVGKYDDVDAANRQYIGR